MTSQPFLYVIVCASGIADDVGKLISAAQEEGWRVGVVATPNAMEFIDTAAIEEQTGYTIRSAWRTPDVPASLPPADAIAVAPATFNTINKWADGHADTLALGILTEAYGLGIPVAAQPYVNSAQAAHPAYEASLQRLRSMGVLFGDYLPHKPKAGGGRDNYNWNTVLKLLRHVLEAKSNA
ncbi:flavoprotein [Streptacidiphilus anmyonensis]|uniref:flavoprotein n=1 Tax=Streptacidiphilus anmyonensis TaxID=405782 RepID=UPI0005A7A5E5|nr:flavoprotein [Streptacidiphilus anmyonensis]